MRPVCQRQKKREALPELPIFSLRKLELRRYPASISAVPYLANSKSDVRNKKRPDFQKNVANSWYVTALPLVLLYEPPARPTLYRYTIILQLGTVSLPRNQVIVQTALPL